VQRFDSVPGHGVVATVEDREVLIGNAKLLTRYGITPDELADRAAALAAEGKTAIYVASDGKPLGLVAVADPVRESARQAVQSLHVIGVTTVMLTGDQRRTAEAVARAVGIIDDTAGGVVGAFGARDRRRAARGQGPPHRRPAAPGPPSRHGRRRRQRRPGTGPGRRGAGP
jgi:cation transport ATPase